MLLILLERQPVKPELEQNLKFVKNILSFIQFLLDHILSQVMAYRCLRQIGEFEGPKAYRQIGEV